MTKIQLRQRISVLQHECAVIQILQIVTLDPNIITNVL